MLSFGTVYTHCKSSQKPLQYELFFSEDKLNGNIVTGCKLFLVLLLLLSRIDCNGKKKKIFGAYLLICSSNGLNTADIHKCLIKWFLEINGFQHISKKSINVSMHSGFQVVYTGN